MSQPVTQSIFRRYWLVITFLVAGVILLVSAVNGYFLYRDSLRNVSFIQQAEARSAALRIDEYLLNIESQIVEVAALPWASGAIPLSDRQFEYFRLLKVQPALRDITLVDYLGQEMLFVSRVEPNRVSSNAVGKFVAKVETRASPAITYSPVFFRDGTEPFTTLSLREGNDPGGPLILADLNLRFVGEIVAGMRAGTTGQAYVVDAANRLLAHPDPSLVLRQSDLSSVRSLQEAWTLLATDHGAILPSSWSKNNWGQWTLSSMVYVPRAKWMVMLEETAEEALAPVFETAYRTVIILALGLVVSFIASRALARSLTRPIVTVGYGAERLAAGDLAARITIDTKDELELLAHQFNHMAEKLNESYAGLERKVQEKTAQLDLANRHKSEFLANMSHELRTPLNAVIGFSSVLQDEYFGKLNDKQQQYISDIHESGEHLLALINDILDLSKIEAGRMDLDLDKVDVEVAISNALTLVRERALKSSIGLACSLAADVPEIMADERKLKQILINLLTNAVKFSNPGGAVLVTAVRVADGIAITVSDDGIGIDNKDHVAVFAEFRQLRYPGSVKHEGTGLGLSLVKRLVELHSGHVSIRSELGAGTSITFTLPQIQYEAHT